jgi:hypothetical protein
METPETVLLRIATEENMDNLKGVTSGLLLVAAKIDLLIEAQE